MFVFDKRLSPEQAINFKPSNKAAFGFMPSLTLGGTGVTVANINAKDPTVAAPPGGETAATPTAVGLLTHVRWDLGATDPIVISGLITIATKQILVGLLYASLTDISVSFGVRVFEYDPVAQTKIYYACFDSGTTPLVGKLQKSGDRELAIEIDDNEELSIQDNSFYQFSMKIVPAKANQIITLASKSLGGITKIWGRTA
ncbi:MAG: hypothetical protein U1A78_39660 [Polyangia bacterium]